MKPEELTIEDCEEALMLPADNWHGMCAGISSGIISAGLVEGHAVYGHYLGDIATDGFWGRRKHHWFVQHGWILLPDGRVLDPTRFSFENKPPYIYLWDNKTDYDEGGNKFRSAMNKPCPKAEDSERGLMSKPARPWDVSQEESQAIESLVGTPFAEISFEQGYWIANLPYEDIASVVGLVYKALGRNGGKAYIPLDNWRRAEREGEV